MIGTNVDVIAIVRNVSNALPVVVSTTVHSNRLAARHMLVKARQKALPVSYVDSLALPLCEHIRASSCRVGQSVSSIVSELEATPCRLLPLHTASVTFCWFTRR